MEVLPRSSPGVGHDSTTQGDEHLDRLLVAIVISVNHWPLEVDTVLYFCVFSFHCEFLTASS